MARTSIRRGGIHDQSVLCGDWRRGDKNFGYSLPPTSSRLSNSSLSDFQPHFQSQRKLPSSNFVPLEELLATCRKLFQTSLALRLPHSMMRPTMRNFSHLPMRRLSRTPSMGVLTSTHESWKELYSSCILRYHSTSFFWRCSPQRSITTNRILCESPKLSHVCGALSSTVIC